MGCARVRLLKDTGLSELSCRSSCMLLHCQSHHDTALRCQCATQHHCLDSEGSGQGILPMWPRSLAKLCCHAAQSMLAYLQP